ncbi:MAG: hypothetical protein K0S16_1666 [Moraxellaceae bacterium]|jgi:hypothetical protein|nr:hypothetical protein [Moraxellaceae bacterium]
MKSIAAALLFCCSTASVAQPATAEGEQLLARFAEALRQKDAAALARLIRPSAPVQILWLDATPAKRFTITGADYVQQMRALWRFSREDRHEFSAVQWRHGSDGRLYARLEHRETRLLQGEASGQDDQLELEMARDSDGLRISRVQAGTKLW